MRKWPLPVLAFSFFLGASLACRATKSSESAPQEATLEFSKRPLTPGESDPCGETAAFGPLVAPPAANSLRVVGGKAVKEGDLISLSTVKIYPVNCTGTLIGPQQVVTAAHCLTSLPDPHSLRLGFGLQGEIADSVRVTGYLQHPLADTLSNYSVLPAEEAKPLHDIAVLSFEGSLPAGLKPVVIAGPQDFREGSYVYLAGYGARGAGDQNYGSLRSVRSRVTALYPELFELQLQSGKKRGGCEGDSGGPSYIISSDRSCLKLVAATVGPGRGVNSSCDYGSGTLMNLTLYHGWLRCSLERLGHPLPYLQGDASSKDCSLPQPLSAP